MITVLMKRPLVVFRKSNRYVFEHKESAFLVSDFYFIITYINVRIAISCQINNMLNLNITYKYTPLKENTTFWIGKNK